MPEWGVDIKCGKGTEFSYGPWADRQREVIYKFFFPPDYQPMKVSVGQIHQFWEYNSIELLSLEKNDLKVLSILQSKGLQWVSDTSCFMLCWCLEALAVCSAEIGVVGRT